MYPSPLGVSGLGAFRVLGFCGLICYDYYHISMITITIMTNLIIIMVTIIIFIII